MQQLPATKALCQEWKNCSSLAQLQRKLYLKSSTTKNSRSTSSLAQLQFKLYLKSSATIEYNCKIQRSLLPPASSTNQNKGKQPLRMRRGTPLTRSWFMPALNTQRFATVLTHQLKCFSHAEYHCNLTMYQFDVKSELQSVCKENLKFNGFPLLSQTHTSIDMHSSCRIPLLCDCLSI